MTEAHIHATPMLIASIPPVVIHATVGQGMSGLTSATPWSVLVSIGFLVP